MLHKEVINEDLLLLLMELQNKVQLSHFSLGGGTALSLHIGHRESTDLDLFTLRPILVDRLKRFLNETYRGNIRYTSEGEESDFIHSFIKNTKVDFLCYKQVYVEEPQKIEGIQILSIKDIAALKLEAIVRHRNAAKDFADIFYLLKNNSLEQLLEYYKIKYGAVDTSNIRKTLLSYNKVGSESWENIKYTKKTTVEEIKYTLREHVEKYYQGHIENNKDSKKQ